MTLTSNGTLIHLHVSLPCKVKLLKYFSQPSNLYIKLYWTNYVTEEHWWAQTLLISEFIKKNSHTHLCFLSQQKLSRFYILSWWIKLSAENAHYALAHAVQQTNAPVKAPTWVRFIYSFYVWELIIKHQEVKISHSVRAHVNIRSDGCFSRSGGRINYFSNPH